MKRDLAYIEELKERIPLSSELRTIGIWWHKKTDGMS